jgi:hypothetical protein
MDSRDSTLTFSLLAAFLAFVFPSFLPSEAKDWHYVRPWYLPLIGTFWAAIVLCAAGGTWAFFVMQGRQVILRIGTTILLLFSYVVIVIGFLEIFGIRR